MSTLVLVVDDNRDNVHLMRQILETRGIEVEYAYDGPTALKLIAQRRPDVVLLDVMMPDMDGMQVLDTIRNDPQHATIPVIMVTAKAQDEDLLSGYRTGADYYITKPFTPKQLLYGVSLVLGREIG